MDVPFYRRIEKIVADLRGEIESLRQRMLSEGEDSYTVGVFRDATNTRIRVLEDIFEVPPVNWVEPSISILIDRCNRILNDARQHLTRFRERRVEDIQAYGSQPPMANQVHVGEDRFIIGQRLIEP